MAGTTISASRGRDGVALQAMVAASLIVALAPIVIACARGIAGGWVPEGDEAIVLLRSRDLFSGSPPLLGMSSTASEAAGMPTNHPGPMLFWMLAPITTIGHGTAASILIATACMVGAAAAVMVLVGLRCAGPSGAVVVAMGVLMLERSLGAAMLRDPLNSAIVILPMGAAIALAVGVLHDGRWAAALVVLASLPMQAYTAYALPGAACLALGGVGLLVVARRDRTVAIRRAMWAVLALSACWAPVAIEQVAGDQHNVSRMIDAAGADVDTLDPQTVASRTAWALGPVPVATRADSLIPPAYDVSEPTWAAALLLLTIAGSALWAGADARRIERSMAIAVIVVGLAGVIGTSRLPTNVSFRGDPFWWMWPWSLLVAVAVTARIGPWLGAEALRRGRRAGVRTDARSLEVATLASLALLALVATPITSPDEDPAAPSREAIRVLGPAIGVALDDDATYSAVPTGMDALISILPGVLASLDSQGVDLALTRAVSGTLGDRITSNTPPTGGDIVLRSGESAPVPGGRLLVETSMDGLRVDAWLVPPLDAAAPPAQLAPLTPPAQLAPSDPMGAS